jgi:hypothetical protein
MTRVNTKYAPSYESGDGYGRLQFEELLSSHSQLLLDDDTLTKPI